MAPMKADKTRQIKNLAAAALFGAAAFSVLPLGGCSALSEGTTEQTSQAKVAAEARKAALEYDQARQAYTGGDMKKALKCIDRSLAINNAVPKSHVLRGRILMEQGNLEDAEKAHKTAIELDKRFADANYFLALVYERLSNQKLALEQYKLAAENDPANPMYAVAAAEMQVDLGQLDEAELYLTTRKNAFEHNAGVRQTLGHIAMLRGQHEKAVSFFNEAKLLAPEDKSITEDLVRAQMAFGQFADAEFNLARLLENEQEERRDLQHLRLSCLLQVDRLLEARELAIKLTQGAAGQADVQAWVQLGNVAFMLNDPTRVRQASARLISIAPERNEGYVIQALQLRRQGNLEGARVSLEKAIKVQPDASGYVLLGAVYQELKRPGDAQKCYQQAIKLNPKDQTARQMLAGVPTQ